MRVIGVLFVAWIVITGATMAQAPDAAQPVVGTMSEVMVSMTYPAANDILLYANREPKDDKEWTTVQRSAVLLAESGNVLMMRGRARDQGEWIKAARLVVDAGAAAYKAARAKDAKALAAVSEPLNGSCIACHTRYRPNVHPQPR